jgi:hypothetical protein
MQDEDCVGAGVSVYPGKTRVVPEHKPGRTKPRLMHDGRNHDAGIAAEE